MPSEDGFAFGPYRLHAEPMRLFRDEEPVALGGRQLTLLHALVTRAERIVAKQELMDAAWRDAFVGDNSLEQEILKLRLTLDPANPVRYIATVKRAGYRFAVPVTPIRPRASDADIEARLPPHRAAREHRAALEALQIDRLARARAAYEALLADRRDDPRWHAGLANACLEQFEATRADARPDTDALDRAANHAREAVRLDLSYADAWATLGLALERTGDRPNALAALRQAVELDPSEWTHHLRLAWGAWGRERLSAARRVLALMPAQPAAHWLSATVLVARGALGEAEREIDAGIAAVNGAPASSAFPPIALHWLAGLLALARGRDDEAMAAFERELADAAPAHVYGRETQANTWYAIGACEWRRGRTAAARQAFDEAIARIPAHAMAHAGIELLDAERRPATGAERPDTFEQAIARAAVVAADDGAPAAARLVESALAAAPPGNHRLDDPDRPAARGGP